MILDYFYLKAKTKASEENSENGNVLDLSADIDLEADDEYVK